MRTPAVVEPDLFSPAERSALRLDGDGFDLGLSTVAVDAVVDAAVRASSLRPAVDRWGLVVDGPSAAWVHGVIPVLPASLHCCVDVARGRATRAMRPAPREVRFAPDEVEVLGGVHVTTPLKTAFDLLLRHGDATGAAALDLLRLTGLSPDKAATRIAAMPKHNGKHRVAARARELLAEAPAAPRQPADTRYTS